MNEYILLTSINNEWKILSWCRRKTVFQAKKYFFRENEKFKEHDLPCHIYKWVGNNFNEVERK